MTETYEQNGDELIETKMVEKAITYSIKALKKQKKEAEELIAEIDRVLGKVS